MYCSYDNKKEKHQGSKSCIHQYCKSCCENIQCKYHNNLKIPPICICGNIIKNTKCVSHKCAKCCDSKLCFHKNYLKCVICNIRNFDKYCNFKYCNGCCKMENCNYHLNENNHCVHCKYRHKDNSCISKYCKTCICNDKSCNIHYSLCKTFECNNIIKKNNCKKCKPCCKNRDCEIHFIQDDELTQQHINDYKTTLYLQRNLPVCIINEIVDKYLDTRKKCYDCNYKFSSFNDCLSYGYAVFCNGCNELMCENCVTMKSSMYTIERFCNDCFEKTIDSDSTISENSNSY
jgi:hypothetical protein